MRDVEYVANILGGITTKPELIDIRRTTDEMGVLICVSVAKEDVGKVIGQNGQTAKAIRTLLNSFGYLNDAKISFKILDKQL